MEAQVYLLRNVDEEGKEIVTFSKTPQALKMYKERYIHNVEYVVYTIKNGNEDYLVKKVGIPHEMLLNIDQLSDLVADMFYEQIDSQQGYDNYDVAQLYSIGVIDVFDKAL
ncbi:hypothetical protein PTQ21_12225 [Paenibacillus marchantiae]|uniref:hypothetical protein n=1 Tax=Paenibacillus marchantiae TaxID=3026433 RepID=UPI00237B5FA3|nr:hypothetical protein [Paenibacillus marchantiae]WDQ34956.1 hypothetical protein PTQ21_12225 [Paenibacillus marchantiae]